MTDVDHTHPHDDPCLGDAFCRGGRRIATDGGRRGTGPKEDAIDETADDPVMDPEDHEPTMREVSHEPPSGDGANDVFQRGHSEIGSERADPTDDEDDLRESSGPDDGDEAV